MRGGCRLGCSGTQLGDRGRGRLGFGRIGYWPAAAAHPFADARGAASMGGFWAEFGEAAVAGPRLLKTGSVRRPVRGFAENLCRRGFAPGDGRKGRLTLRSQGVSRSSRSVGLTVGRDLKGGGWGGWEVVGGGGGGVGVVGGGGGGRGGVWVGGGGGCGGGGGVGGGWGGGMGSAYKIRGAASYSCLEKRHDR